MINSQFTQYVSGLGGEDVDFHDIKVHQLNYPQPEGKPAKVINAKNNINVPGSSSNLNASSNGVYVDMGKVLLEAAKSGDSDKVQECVKNGAPFITDWVSWCPEFGRTTANYFYNSSSGHRRYMLQLKIITSTHVPHSFVQVSARMQRPRLTEHHL